MLDCNIFPGLAQEYLDTEVNMFLLPVQENDGEDNLNKTGWLKKHIYIRKGTFCFLSLIYLFFPTVFRSRNISTVLSAARL